MRYHSLLLLALAVVVVDQVTKFVMPSFITVTHNTGAAFGVLQGERALLILIGAGVSVFLLWYLRSHHSIWLALILGGAVSNLLDRVIRGYVIDFIDLGWWPSFNVADSCMTVGVVVLLIQSLRE